MSGREPARLRVLHVIPGLGLGGAERLLCALVAALPEVAHTVLCLRPGGALAAPLVASGAVLVTPAVAEAPLADAVALGRAARRARPHVVHGWTYAGALAAAAAAAACVTQPALIFGLHAEAPDAPGMTPRTRVLARAVRALARTAAAVTFPGPVSRAAHRLGRNVDAQVLTGGVDTDAFAPQPGAAAALRRQLGIGPRARVLAHVARVVPEKDQATLLAALALGRRREVHLVMVGPGTRPLPASLRPLIRGLPLHLLGPRQDVRPIVAGSDLFTLSSRSESLPLAAMEAMACGTPAVLTAVGDCALAVGDAGRLVAPGSPLALAAAWAELLDDPPTARRRRRAAARAHACAHLGVGPWAAAHRDLYRDATTT